MAKKKTGYTASVTDEERAEIQALQAKMGGLSFSKLVVHLVRGELARMDAA